MSIEAIKDLLKKEEGYRRFPYQCTAGKWTIGYGRNIDPLGGTGISEYEADFLLGMDVRGRVASLEKLLDFWGALPEIAQTVLVCMAFQLGTGGLLQFRTFLEHLKAKEWAEAAESMLQSLWARQTPARAQRMSELIKTLA